MAQSNYDITLSRMPGEFLKYDQQRMIRMFCREHDAQYLYLRLLDRRHIQSDSGMPYSVLASARTRWNRLWPAP